MAGKGDKYRPVDYKKYSENYDRIFGKSKQETPKKPEEKKHQCPECGEYDNHECKPRGYDVWMTYGRGGWRQLGVYDG